MVAICVDPVIFINEQELCMNRILINFLSVYVSFDGVNKRCNSIENVKHGDYVVSFNSFEVQRLLDRWRA